MMRIKTCCWLLEKATGASLALRRHSSLQAVADFAHEIERDPVTAAEAALRAVLPRAGRRHPAVAAMAAAAVADAVPASLVSFKTTTTCRAFSHMGEKAV